MMRVRHVLAVVSPVAGMADLRIVDQPLRAALERHGAGRGVVTGGFGRQCTSRRGIVGRGIMRRGIVRRERAARAVIVNGGTIV